MKVFIYIIFDRTFKKQSKTVPHVEKHFIFLIIYKERLAICYFLKDSIFSSRSLNQIITYKYGSKKHSKSFM